MTGLRALCEQATVGCAIQLDHATDLELIRAGLDSGVGAVMADASSEPFAANVDFVARAVGLAATYGAAVEAELGRVEGDEEAAAGTLAGTLTDPTEAKDFIATTDVDCLAVSIGNVHGHYRSVPTLDLPRLQAIATRVSRPLSLHGASGLPSAMVGAAIARASERSTSTRNCARPTSLRSSAGCPSFARAFECSTSASASRELDCRSVGRQARRASRLLAKRECSPALTIERGSIRTQRGLCEPYCTTCRSSRSG